jgi:hypothetical protein
MKRILTAICGLTLMACSSQTPPPAATAPAAEATSSPADRAIGQVALPTTAADVTAPAPGVEMHPAYAKVVARQAYVSGWPMVNVPVTCPAPEDSCQCNFAADA